MGMSFTNPNSYVLPEYHKVCTKRCLQLFGCVMSCGDLKCEWMEWNHTKHLQGRLVSRAVRLRWIRMTKDRLGTDCAICHIKHSCALMTLRPDQNGHSYICNHWHPEMLFWITSGTRQWWWSYFSLLSMVNDDRQFSNTGGQMFLKCLALISHSQNTWHTFSYTPAWGPFTNMEYMWLYSWTNNCTHYIYVQYGVKILINFQISTVQPFHYGNG